ncbi:ras-like RABD2a-like protein [Perkinsela sp. CCAP 1560/4]|nr:ras-like RABD2a-like protein [Perkinsela sp. CCAP 1560/4]KNH08923.1 ras-like RABD2a-like protein [Perkinsela sp. CCAP 1560/4]|eukprot:KNH04289.1 ras-like RABD2a-like protein [Perkinsela sp. CCAP 1560/4]
MGFAPDSASSMFLPYLSFFFMRHRDYDHVFKVLIIGDSGVGKSSILVRFTDNSFDGGVKATVGVDFKVRTLTSNGANVKLQIWDTAGQERFRSITRSYYRGAQAILVVYDITSAESFHNVKSWLDEVETSASPNVCTVLVGNKCDDAATRAVSYATGKTFADSHGLTFSEVSARDSTCVDALFHHVVGALIQRVDSADAFPPPQQTRDGGLRARGGGNSSERSSCC